MSANTAGAGQLWFVEETACEAEHAFVLGRGSRAVETSRDGEAVSALGTILSDGGSEWQEHLEEPRLCVGGEGMMMKFSFLMAKHALTSEGLAESRGCPIPSQLLFFPACWLVISKPLEV